MKQKNKQWDYIDPQLQNTFKQQISRNQAAPQAPNGSQSPQGQFNFQNPIQAGTNSSMNMNPPTGKLWDANPQTQQNPIYSGTEQSAMFQNMGQNWMNSNFNANPFTGKPSSSYLLSQQKPNYSITGESYSQPLQQNPGPGWGNPAGPVPPTGNFPEMPPQPGIHGQNSLLGYGGWTQNSSYPALGRDFSAPYVTQPYGTNYPNGAPFVPAPTNGGGNPDNRPLTGFGEGLAQYGKRVANDFSYNLGKIKSWWNDEEDMQNAYQSAQKQMGDISSWSNDDLKNQIANIKNQIYQRTTRPPEKRPDLSRNGIYDEETGAINENDYLTKKNHYINALEGILEMRENGSSPGQINQQVNDYITRGGEGTRQMRESLEQNDRFKETQGWAKAAEVGAGIAQQAIPIAAGLVFPPAGIAMGAANVGTMAAQSHAQSQMDIDREERDAGEKIPDWKRAAYVGSYAGADLLVNGLLQGRYLGKLSAPLMQSARKGVMSQMMKSPQATKELTSLLKNYKNINIGKLATEIGTDAGVQGLSQAGTSVAQDMAARIYTDRENYPALNEILQNAARSGIEGGIIGGALGGISHAGGKAVQNIRRKNNDGITLVETRHSEPMELLGQTEAGTYKVLTPEGKHLETYFPFDQETISKIPYDDYNRIAKTSAKEYEKLPSAPPKEKPEEINLTPSVRINNPNSPWLNTKDTPEQRYRKRKEAEEISKKLGIDVKIYDRQSELPLEIQQKLQTKDIMPGYFSPGNKEVSVVLDNIYSQAEFKKTLMREAVAKKGIQALYGENTDTFLDQVYKSIPAETQAAYKKGNRSNRKAAEEYLSDMAEKGVDNPGLWNNVQTYTRQILRDKMGKDFDLNDNELQYILWKARNRITNKDSMKEMRNKNNREQQIKQSMFPTQYPPKKPE